MTSMSLGSSSSSIPRLALPDLPADPFEQLEIARQIAENAWKQRVLSLERDIELLKDSSDPSVVKAYNKVAELEKRLDESVRKLSRTIEEQAKLDEERNMLVSTVKKLNREVFRLQSLKGSLTEAAKAGINEEGKVQADTALDPSGPRTSVEILETNDEFLNYFGKENGRDQRNPRFRAVSSEGLDMGLEGRLAGARILRSRPGNRSSSFTTPSLSPFIHASQSGTPEQSSRQMSPSRKKLSGDFGGLNSVPGPISQSSVKEFFKVARKRLTFEDFKGFLQNIKDLNQHKKSREEALSYAKEKLQDDNDLFADFLMVLDYQKKSKNLL